MSDRLRPVLLALALPLAVGGAAAEPAPQAVCGLEGFQASVLQAINQARATPRTCGQRRMAATPPLAWNARLGLAARAHADDMARHDYFSHTGRNGRNVAERVSDTGYAWSAVGENIAAGPDSVDAVMAGWLSSPGHCVNLMRPDFREVAVSCVQRSGNTYGRYWAMVLGSP